MSLLRRIILAFALIAGIAPAFAQAPPPVPALPDAERRTSYSLSGSTCACAVGFALYGDAADYANWLEVWVNGTLVPQSGNWTITSPSSADLSRLPRPITDAVLTFTQAQTGTVQIVGARRPRRTSQFAENRGVAARDLNQVLTDIVAQNRETWDKLNDVTGRTVLAPPGETLAVLANAASRASQGACFDAGGNLVSCVSVPGSTFTAGNGISLTGVGPTTITNNIQGSGPITITGTNPLLIGCPTCNTSPAATTQAVFIASRTSAASLDLRSFAVIRTGGYGIAGDGGGATFQNNAGAITSISITTAGSGCTNAVTAGIYFTGGTGRRAQGTATVTGNIVTGFTMSGAGGQGIGYAAGNVLTAVNVPGCLVQPTFTINTVGAAAFIDSQVNSVNINSFGTGCTPGTYFGVFPIGGFGSGLQGNATINGGGTLVSFAVTGTGGGGYRVGDTLSFTSASPAIPGCSSQPSLTVAGVTSPAGSFTDAGGTGWQIIPDPGGINIRQFGALQNYVRAKGDAGATNDGGPIQAALRFAAIGDWFTDAGGFSGNTVIIPTGASLVCSGLQVPAHVTLSGTSRGGSMLKQCDSDNLASNFITLGDPQNHQNAFDANLKDLTLFGGGSSMGSGFMVYSNSSQSANSLDNVAIYSLARGCIKYEIGYGGPSGFGVHGGLCVPNGTLSPSPAINLSGNFSFTFDNNWQTSVGGPKWTGTAIALGAGGTFQMNSGAHCENLTICVDYDGSVGAPMMVSIISNVGNAAVDKYVSIRTGSVTGVGLQGFSANSVACNVYKVATASCVSTGNIPGLSTF